MPVASRTSHGHTNGPGIHRLWDSFESSELGIGEVQVWREKESSAQRWEAKDESSERGRGHTHFRVGLLGPVCSVLSKRTKDGAEQTCSKGSEQTNRGGYYCVKTGFGLRSCHLPRVPPNPQKGRRRRKSGQTTQRSAMTGIEFSIREPPTDYYPARVGPSSASSFQTLPESGWRAARGLPPSE